MSGFEFFKLKIQFWILDNETPPFYKKNLCKISITSKPNISHHHQRKDKNNYSTSGLTDLVKSMRIPEKPKITSKTEVKTKCIIMNNISIIESDIFDFKFGKTVVNIEDENKAKEIQTDVKIFESLFRSKKTE